MYLNLMWACPPHNFFFLFFRSSIFFFSFFPPLDQKCASQSTQDNLPRSIPGMRDMTDLMHGTGYCNFLSKLHPHKNHKNFQLCSSTAFTYRSGGQLRVQIPWSTFPPMKGVSFFYFSLFCFQNCCFCPWCIFIFTEKPFLCVWWWGNFGGECFRGCGTAIWWSKCWWMKIGTFDPFHTPMNESSIMTGFCCWVVCWWNILGFFQQSAFKKKSSVLWTK